MSKPLMRFKLYNEDDNHEPMGKSVNF